MTRHTTLTRRTRAGALVTALGVLALSACDTSVTNPGPVQDSFLDSLNAHAAIVNGATRNLSDALDAIAYWSAVLTYEINPAGSTGSFGIPTYIQDGRIDQRETGDWNAVSLARFTSEDALRRFEEVLPQITGAPAVGSYGPAAEAALLAGYANRLFGETFCEVVYDGGSEQPSTDALARAETYFQRAEQIGTAAGLADVATAAIAGRASVLADLASYGLASWSSAATEAARVTDNDFVHVAPYSAQDQSQSNYIMIAAPGTGTYRAHTQWGTYYEDYYRQTGDPRVPWVTDPEPYGDAAVTKFGGNVFFYPQDKYNDQDDPINLSSGWEMRLIEAEAELQAGDADGAIGFMNQRLTDLGLATLTPGSMTVAQAYTELKRQRMLELWLENRRMFDLRRWEDNNISGGISDVLDGVYGTGTANVPGVGDETPVGVLDTTLTTLATNARCWPIGDSEYATNTNVNR